MKLALHNVGQISEAEVEFGDLTVLVGPDARTKSVFLQFLKLMLDGPKILHDLKTYKHDWGSDLGDFLDMYLGEGMRSIWRAQGAGASRVIWEGATLDLATRLGSFAKARKDKRIEKVFFVPTQRVSALGMGLPRPFKDFAAGDPYVLPCFSDKLRIQMEAGLGTGENTSIFPQRKRFNSELNKAIGGSVFQGLSLKLDRTDDEHKRFVLEGKGERLPFMLWTAGQREFIPLLLGLYWLCPMKTNFRREPTEWVIIEEPEVGLHPEAISAVMLAVLELLLREYSVVISTHSPHVLDVIWGLRTIQHYRADPGMVYEIFDRQHTEGMKRIAEAAMRKDYRVFHFYSSDSQGQVVRDISELDPGSENPWEANWGGLTALSARVGEVVADVVSNSGPEGWQ